MKTLRGYYITQWSNDEKGFYPGPARKINGQIKALRSYGLNVEFVGREYNFDIKNVSILKRILMQIYSRLPFTEVLKEPDYTPVRMPDISEVKDANFLYIRFWWGDYKFGKAIERLRRQNPKATIFLEFPDYPYLQKSKGIHNYYMILKDKNCSKKYKGNIDYMISMDYVNSIYEVPSIHMYNGIDTDKIKQRQVIDDHENTINIGFVATAKKSHGIDRLIEGMKQYYEQKETEYVVMLHLIGGGTAMQEALKYAKDNKIDSYVKGYGYVFDDELDSIYDFIDLAVDYLALHREKYKISSSLKSREYLARGIPIITSAYLDICQDFNFNHMLIVDSSEDPIDINQIVDFYKNEYKNGSADVIKEIREFAVRHVDMKSTMCAVYDKLTDKMKEEG